MNAHAQRLRVVGLVRRYGADRVDSACQQALAVEVVDVGRMPELRQTLQRLKLSPLLETRPERLRAARQQKMSHAELLELVLSDEID